MAGAPKELTADSTSASRRSALALLASARTREQSQEHLVDIPRSAELLSFGKC